MNQIEIDYGKRFLKENQEKAKKRSLRYLDIDRTAYRMNGNRIVKSIKIDW